MGFPGGSVVKNLPASAGDAGSIPRSGRSPGEGNSNPLQCSCAVSLPRELHNLHAQDTLSAQAAVCLPLTWDVCWASSGPEPYPLGLVAPRPPVEKKIGLKRQKKMSSALLSLSRSVQELTEENQSLKEDLDR